VSDSFSALWSALCEECGFDLSRTEDPAAVAGAGVVAVNVAGVEQAAPGILEQLPRSSGPVVVVGALADYRTALAAVRAGAAEYFALPEDLELFRRWLREQAEIARSAESHAMFASQEAAKYRFDGMLGESPALRETLQLAARVIPHGGVTVLLNGETGTGKELLARAIHYNGPRKKAPFVDVNCAAIPENLLESELFGHEKGAFTGASAAKPGLFEIANGGTIFLDEIGHLSLQLQGKLLRVLEQREFRRVGGTANISVDVRVIAATHVDLAEASKRGEFREDLYYRLNVVGLRLPALRERSGDLMILARSFLARFAREYGIPEPALSPLAMRRLLSHPWSGNIRELRNVLERALLLAAGNELAPEDLGLDARLPVAQSDSLPFPATLADINRGAAEAMTRLCDGNKSEAARRLGISRTRLLRLLAPLGEQADVAEQDV
jgi:DNA-binding NtrC family response regulator